MTKVVFTTEPILAILDINKKMRVEANASDYATGGVLLTKCEDGKWRLVAFISKSLNTTEWNYKIHDKEMLAVIRYLEVWRHYLEGAKLEFEIWTDYKNLQYFMTSQKLNHRQARWALYLSRFNFILKHVLGKSMGKVDGLSRRLDWQEGVEKDNENQKLVKPEWIRRVETIIEEENLKERIKRVQEGDKKVVKVVEELKKAGVKTLKDKEWKIEDRIVMKEGRIYVPEGGPQEGNNTITPRHPSRRAWYPSRRAQREIEDGRVDCQELLVARSNKRGRKIHGQM